MARVDPLPIRGWPPEMREALAAMLPPVERHPRPQTEGRPKGMNILGTFAHYPALARAWFTINGHLLLATTLTLRQREIVVLRVATLCQCSYEWAQHVVVGRDVGLTDTEITLVTMGPDAPFLDPLDAAVIRAVDELFEDRAISRETWAALAADLDTQQLLDLIFTTGAYQTLALVMRSFELELDDDLVAAVTKEPS
jgi:alkylhydroperoxidase family enzyme